MGKYPKGRAILSSFRELYWDKANKDYHVNYAMIVMAEKISDFYTQSEIDQAMEYYFKYNEPDFYQFINNIDKYYSASQKAKNDVLDYNNLEDDTRKQLRKIRESGIGEG